MNKYILIDLNNHVENNYECIDSFMWISVSIVVMLIAGLFAYMYTMLSQIIQ